MGSGRPQIQGRARALSWAVATRVAWAISSGSAKACPARAWRRKIRHQPSCMLLSWALIGLDPIRRRPGIKARLAALVVAGAAHDTLAKLMYAHSLPVGGGSLASRHAGAELMYYGGTVIDIALAIVLMAQWYQASGRALARTARRRNAGAHAHLISDRQTRNPSVCKAERPGGRSQCQGL